MLFNGYGDEVASLYKGLKKKPLYALYVTVRGHDMGRAGASGRRGSAACLHFSRSVYVAVISERCQEEIL